LVTAGAAKDEPLPAMLCGVTANTPSGGTGGVGDDRGHVVVVVDDAVVDVDEVVLGVVSAAAGVPTATSTSSEVAPTSADAPQRRRDPRCMERRSISVFTDFIRN
jgi:hypothetical protein